MKCNICGRDSKKIDELSNILNVTQYYNDVKNSINADIQIYWCQSCNHFFIQSILSDDYYDNYEMVYNPNELSCENGYPKQLLYYYNNYFNKMYDMCKSHDKLLDIGSASGEFLALLQERYKKVKGIEPSSVLCEKSRKKGLDVIHGYYGSKKYFNECFDCIICCSVLEHIDDLNSFMQEISIDIAEDGVVLVTVPNGQKIVQSRSYSDFFPEHINYFTPKSLTEVCHRNGFDICSIEEGFGNGFYLIAYIKKRKYNNPYLILSEKKQEDSKKVNDILNNYSAVGVWGIGVRSRIFLSAIKKDINIKALIDSNILLEGKYIPDISIPIQRPSEKILKQCDAILITSVEYCEEIIFKINELGFNHDILYIKNGEIIIRSKEEK